MVLSILARIHGSRADRDSGFGPGNWYGNDTAWRMALDLNRILRFADAKGVLHERPQRRFFSIVDGIIAGEGDGPLGARAKPCGVLLAGCDAAAVDFVAASLMGFAPDDIPLVREAFAPTRLRVASSQRGDLNIVSSRPAWQGKAPIAGLCEHLDFLPPRGWLPLLGRGRRSDYAA